MGVLAWIFPEFRQGFAKLDIVNHNRVFFFLVEFQQKVFSPCYPVEWSADHAESGEVSEVKHVGNAFHWFKISDQSYIPPLPCFINIRRFSCEKSKVHITMGTLWWAQPVQPRCWSLPLKATTQPRRWWLSRTVSVFSRLWACWPCTSRLLKESSTLSSWGELSKLMLAKLSFLIDLCQWSFGRSKLPLSILIYLIECATRKQLSCDSLCRCCCGFGLLTTHFIWCYIGIVMKMNN